MEQPFNILFQGNIKTKKESSSTSSTACHDYGHQQINFLQFKPEDLKPSSCRLDFERLTQLNQLHIQRCLDVEQKTLELAVQLRQLLATSPKFSCYADTISQEDIVHILQESKVRKGCFLVSVLETATSLKILLKIKNIDAMRLSL